MSDDKRAAFEKEYQEWYPLSAEFRLQRHVVSSEVYAGLDVQNRWQFFQAGSEFGNKAGAARAHEASAELAQGMIGARPREIATAIRRMAEEEQNG